MNFYPIEKKNIYKKIIFNLFGLVEALRFSAVQSRMCTDLNARVSTQTGDKRINSYT